MSEHPDNAQSANPENERGEIELTRADKRAPLIVKAGAMPAAGTFGFGDAYRDTVEFGKLGAIVTNPVSMKPRKPARSVRVVSLDGGVLVHTGLPNPGLSAVLKRYRELWSLLPVPIILHLIATDTDEIRRAMRMIDEAQTVAGVELGLDDDIDWRQAQTLVRAAAQNSEKPLLVRLPLLTAVEIAEAVIEAEAGALVVAAPPRGTARDPHSGALVRGRIYGPLIKPIALRLVGQLTRHYGQDLPIIGAGGIHSQQDARDYIVVAKARAVQVDTVTWVQPKMLEYIARDLAGNIVTKDSDALADEWYPGMGDTEKAQRDAEKRAARDDQDTAANGSNGEA